MYFDDCITHKKSNLYLPSPKPTETRQPLKLILAVRNDYYRSKNNVRNVWIDTILSSISCPRETYHACQQRRIELVEKIEGSGRASGEETYHSADIHHPIHEGTNHRLWTPTSSLATVFPAYVLVSNAPAQDGNCLSCATRYCARISKDKTRTYAC
jgi:hypothetical protein